MEQNGVGLETELRLGLPGGGEVEKNEKKRVFDDFVGGEEKAAMHKNQVVGWPPVAAFRRKNSFNGGKMYVKVSMDGAPFLRKVDLNMHKGYPELVRALEELFGCFGIGEFISSNIFTFFIFVILCAFCYFSCCFVCYKCWIMQSSAIIFWSYYIYFVNIIVNPFFLVLSL